MEVLLLEAARVLGEVAVLVDHQSQEHVQVFEEVLEVEVHQRNCENVGWVRKRSYAGTGPKVR